MFVKYFVHVHQLKVVFFFQPEDKCNFIAMKLSNNKLFVFLLDVAYLCLLSVSEHG